MMTTKGKSMSLTYWRERADRFEEESNGYWALWNEAEAKLAEQKRISQSNRSKKNYWKREALKARKEITLQKSMRKNVEIMNEVFSSFNDHLIESKGEIIEKWDEAIKGWSKANLLAIRANFAFYAQLALWIIWS